MLDRQHGCIQLKDEPVLKLPVRPTGLRLYGGYPAGVHDSARKTSLLVAIPRFNV
jgi:hypothetical protein